MCKHIYNPDQTYLEGTPFTYFIGWSKLNKFYYGVRYGKIVRPSDLWSSYFTSSPSLWQFRIDNGEPDIIKVDFTYDTKEEALAYEEYILTRNDHAHNPNWLNLHNGGKNFCPTEESIKKMADTRRGVPRNVEAIKKAADANRGRIRINNGIKEKQIKPEQLQEHLDLGWKIGSLPMSEVTKKKIGDANRGKTGKKHTEATKKKISDANKGKPGSFKGKNHTEVTKQKIRDKKRGVPRNIESIKKSADSQRGTICINNGIKQKYIIHEQLQKYLDLGWFSGGLPRTPETIQKIKGKIWINNGLEEKQIKPEFLQDFLNLEWGTGRLPFQKQTTEAIEKRVNAIKGKIHISNGVIDLFVYPEEAEIIYSFGFIKGKITSS